VPLRTVRRAAAWPSGTGRPLAWKPFVRRKQNTLFACFVSTGCGVSTLLPPGAPQRPANRTRQAARDRAAAAQLTAPARRTQEFRGHSPERAADSRRPTHGTRDTARRHNWPEVSRFPARMPMCLTGSRRAHTDTHRNFALARCPRGHYGRTALPPRAEVSCVIARRLSRVIGGAAGSAAEGGQSKQNSFRMATGGTPGRPCGTGPTRQPRRCPPWPSGLTANPAP